MGRCGPSGRLSPGLRCRRRFRVTWGWRPNLAESQVRSCPGLAVCGCWLTGERPAWFWLATGRVALIGGLPRQASGYQFVRATGGWAVQAGPAAQVGCDLCAGPRRAVYFLADHGRAVTQVGLADAVAPGTAGALWLTSYPSGAEPRIAAGVAREVSITGLRSGRRSGFRPGTWSSRERTAAYCWPRWPRIGNDARHVVGSSPAAQSQLCGSDRGERNRDRLGAAVCRTLPVCRC